MIARNPVAADCENPCGSCGAAHQICSADSACGCPRRRGIALPARPWCDPVTSAMARGWHLACPLRKRPQSHQGRSFAAGSAAWAPAVRSRSRCSHAATSFVSHRLKLPNSWMHGEGNGFVLRFMRRNMVRLEHRKRVHRSFAERYTKPVSAAPPAPCTGGAEFD